MWATLGKYVGGKVLTAILVVGAIMTTIWFWRHPEQLATIWAVIKFALAWIGFAIVFPWALFFVPAMVIRYESNAAGALMLLGYLLVDILMALWLAGWQVSGTLTWAVLLLGFLAAGVYNFLVCEFLATRAEENL